MKNIKRALAVMLAACMALSFAACNLTADKQESEYPVEIGHSVIQEKPQKVVVLCDSVADILIACGYENKLTAKSDECAQEELKDVQSVGSKLSPATADIIKLNPNVIFADKNLPYEQYKTYTDAGITVLRMVKAQTQEELVTLYKNICSVVDGKISGAKKGEATVNEIISKIEKYSGELPDRDTIPTACYLFDLEGNAVTGDMYASTIMGYSGANNIAADLTGGKLTFEQIKKSNPKYIFCAAGVKERIATNVDYKSVYAVKTGGVFEMPQEYITRQGNTLSKAVKYMSRKIFPTLGGNKPKADGSLAKEYEVEINDDTSAQPEESSSLVKAVQTRLSDLGYWQSEEITGYFGALTESAVKSFKQANGLDSSSAELSKNDLLVLFSKTAIAREVIDSPQAQTNEQ